MSSTASSFELQKNYPKILNQMNQSIYVPCCTNMSNETLRIVQSHHEYSRLIRQLAAICESPNARIFGGWKSFSQKSQMSTPPDSTHSLNSIPWMFCFIMFLSSLLISMRVSLNALPPLNVLCHPRLLCFVPTGAHPTHSGQYCRYTNIAVLLTRYD